MTASSLNLGDLPEPTYRDVDEDSDVWDIAPDVAVVRVPDEPGHGLTALVVGPHVLPLPAPRARALALALLAAQDTTP